MGGHGDLALAADAIDGGWSGTGNDAHHLVEAHGTELRRGHGHLGQTLDAAAELLLGADHDVVLVFAGVEGGGRLAGDQGVERHFDVHHADAEIGGARAIDLQAHFRLAAAQRGIGVHQAGVKSHLGEQRLGILGELLQVRPLDEVLDFRIALVAAHGADQFHAGVNLRWVLLHQYARALHELLLGNLALVDIGQLDVDDGAVDALIGASAGGHQGVRHTGQLADILRDLLRQVGGGGDRRSLRSAYEDVVLRLIVLRQEVLADEHKQRSNREDDAHARGHHDTAVRHAPGEHAGVPEIEVFEDERILGRVLGAAGCWPGVLRRLDEAGAEHRGKREGDEQRNRDGKGGGEAERAHEAAHDAAHESHRQEHRKQAQGGGHDGEADFLGALNGRLERRHMFFLDETVDIFEHDNGVVNHDTDHQGQGQHGDLVEGEPHGGHQGESGHDGSGNGNGGDQGGAYVGQEEEDDDGREEAALDQVLLDLIHGGLDKDGLIADHLRPDIRRQRSGNLLEPLFDRLGGGNRIHAALFGYDQGYRRDTIEAGGGPRFLIAVFRPADIRHLHHVAVARGHGDLVELRGVENASGGAYGKLAGAVVQIAARQCQILGAQGVEHVVDGEGAGTQAVRIHLHMDLAARAAHDGDLADAGSVFQLLFDLLVGDQGDVSQGTPGGDGNLQNGRGIGIEFLNHRLLSGLRQLRHDEVDLVLHFLGGHVAVLGQLELNDDQRLAFGRGGAHLVHLADGVDRVLHLLGDFGFDLLGRSAGVGDDHQDGGDIALGKRSTPSVK